jgi:hypothetical protein
VKLLVAVLALNEMQHLPALWAQHRDWPGADVTFVFVEAADAVYQAANPGMVSPAGLSTDGTSEFLRDLARSDARVRYLPVGLVRHPDPAQGKCVARQHHLDVAERVRPDYVWVLDADEAYGRAAQLRVNLALARCRDGLALQQRHAWVPPGSGVAPFTLEAQGGYWDVPHPRGWRWRPGLRYAANHNLPAGVRCERLPRAAAPECVHLGFASSPESRRAKHAYYRARGEGVRDRRQGYVLARAAWHGWRPGGVLPGGARVVPWGAEVPECFREGVLNVGAGNAEGHRRGLAEGA